MNTNEAASRRIGASPKGGRPKSGRPKGGKSEPGAVFPAGISRRAYVVCLCGSTRFKEAFEAENARLTRARCVVLAPGVYVHDLPRTEDIGEKEKAALDELHLYKVSVADEVRVVNIGGYIGDSTRAEIEHALTLGIPVSFVEDAHPGTAAHCAGCSRSGFVPYLRLRAVDEFRALGWRPAGGGGWLCRECSRC